MIAVGRGAISWWLGGALRPVAGKGILDMNILETRNGSRRSPHRAGLAALGITALCVGLWLPMAGARDDDHRGGWRHDEDRVTDRHHDERHEWHGRSQWRDDGDYYNYRPRYAQPYYYSAPVYVPPPVYYAPRQSPGISLFFPLDLR